MQLSPISAQAREVRGQLTTMPPETLERTYDHAKEKLLHRGQAMRRSNRMDLRSAYEQQLHLVYFLTAQRAKTEPARMLPACSNFIRQSIAFPRTQRRFARLWKRLMLAQAKIHGPAFLVEETNRQLELFRQAEDMMGALRNPAQPAPFVAMASSLLEQSSKEKPAAPTYTLGVRAPARHAL